MMDQQSLAARTLAIPELLEHILLSLPTSPSSADSDVVIVRAQLVARSWRAIIRGSGRLQKRIYMLAEPPAPGMSAAERRAASNNISVITPYGTMSIPHPAESMQLKGKGEPRVRVNGMVTKVAGLPPGLWRISSHLWTPDTDSTTASSSDSDLSGAQAHSLTCPKRRRSHYPYWLPIQDPLLYDIYRSRTPDLTHQQPVGSSAAADGNAASIRRQSWRRMFVTQPPATLVRVSLVHESVVLSFRSKKLVHSARRYRSRVLTAAEAEIEMRAAQVDDLDLEEGEVREHPDDLRDERQGWERSPGRGVRLGQLIDVAEGFLREEFESAQVEGPRMWPMKEHVWIVEALVEGVDGRSRDWGETGGKGVFWKDAAIAG